MSSRFVVGAGLREHTYRAVCHFERRVVAACLVLIVLMLWTIAQDARMGPPPVPPPVSPSAWPTSPAPDAGHPRR